MLHSNAGHHKNNRNAVWYGLLASPLTWAAHFLIGYGLVEAACRANALHALIFGLPLLSIIILVLTLVAVLITLSIGLVAYRHWQSAKSQSLRSPGNPATSTDANIDDPTSSRTEDMDSFMAMVGVWSSALFSMIILVTGLPALFLNPC